MRRLLRRLRCRLTRRCGPIVAGTSPRRTVSLIMCASCGRTLVGWTGGAVVRRDLMRALDEAARIAPLEVIEDLADILSAAQVAEDSDAWAPQ